MPDLKASKSSRGRVLLGAASFTEWHGMEFLKDVLFLVYGHENLSNVDPFPGEVGSPIRHFMPFPNLETIPEGGFELLLHMGNHGYR